MTNPQKEIRVYTRPGEPGGMSLFGKNQGEPGEVVEKI